MPALRLRPLRPDDETAFRAACRVLETVATLASQPAPICRYWID
jgi:hypothetical protein